MLNNTLIITGATIILLAIELFIVYGLKNLIEWIKKKKNKKVVDII